LFPWLILSAIGFASAFQMLTITDKGGMGDHSKPVKATSAEDDQLVEDNGVAATEYGTASPGTGPAGR
jgi:hypothetical protein